jgi:hypothetical protein
MNDHDADRPSTAELVRNAAEQFRDLLRAEANVTRGELKTELKAAAGAAGAIGAAVFAGLFAFAALLAALLVALNVTVAWALFISGCVMLAIALGGIAFAFTTAPRQAVPRTRERLRNDIHTLRSHRA